MALTKATSRMFRNGAVVPEDFGAIGDGVADDTVALQAMVAHVNSLSFAKVLFYGLYKTTQKLAFTCPNLTLDFEIKGESGLLCSNCDGIEVTHTSRYDNFSSENMLMITDAQKLYTGFKYQNTAPSTGDQPVKIMTAPTFIGEDRYNIAGGPYVEGWLTAIRVDNGDRFYIDKPWLQGAEKDRVDGFPIASKGVYGTGCTHLVLNDANIFIFETGVEIDGQSEGCEVLGGSIVANKKGINFNPTGTPANDTNIRGTHIASMDYNIKIGGGTLGTVMHDIEGCLLFTRTESYVSPTFKHIIVDGQTQISGNFFFTAAGIDPTNHVAVDIVQPPTGVAFNVQVLGNLFYIIPTVTQIASGVLNTLIANNSTRDNGATIVAPPVSNSGTGTQIGLNYGDRDFGEVKSDTGVFWSSTSAPGFYVGLNKNKAFTATQGSVSAVNHLDAVNSAAGSPVVLRALGTDATINLQLRPKANGAVTPTADGANNLGSASNRWAAVFAVSPTINTSDENEKQDIRSISDAEKSVAVVLKSQMKAFRFKSAVAEKEDGARVHFGIMAQAIAAAFEAEGLDPTRYGVFCSDTWVDEDGVSHTRLGVRYEELFAFIISAL